MEKSIKQQIIEYLEDRGYHFDPGYRGHKYRKLVFGPRPLDDAAAFKGALLVIDGVDCLTIFVGNAGAFRQGRTVAEARSITDDLRRLLALPLYGDSAPYYRQGRLNLNAECKECAEAKLEGRVSRCDLPK